MMTPRDLSWISMSLHDLPSLAAWGRLRGAWVLAWAASLRLAFPSVSLCPSPLRGAGVCWIAVVSEALA